jgi:hypothetical protein
MNLADADGLSQVREGTRDGEWLTTVSEYAGIEVRGNLAPIWKAQLSVTLLPTYLALWGLYWLGNSALSKTPFPPWLLAVLLPPFTAIGIFLAWLSVREFPRLVRLTTQGIWIEYRRIEMHGSWADWSVRGYVWPASGVVLQYMGGIGYYVTKEQANAIFAHPLCPHWDVPKAVRRLCNVPWLEAPSAFGSL